MMHLARSYQASAQMSRGRVGEWVTQMRLSSWAGERVAGKAPGGSVPAPVCAYDRWPTLPLSQYALSQPALSPHSHRVAQASILHRRALAPASADVSWLSG